MSCTQAVKLWLTVGTNNSYHLALSIPLEDFQSFTSNPFAWLRYVASTIHGREGHISLTPHGTEIDEDDIKPKEYYYVSQDSALLLDPALMDDRTSITTAESTASQDNFRQRVTDRDGTCVLTGCGENLTACHIVPHAKTHQGSHTGFKYMVNLANHRGKDMVPPLDDINDTRNGILLYSSFHRAFGESRVAFLRTPNFAMAVTDVNRVARPGVHLQPLGTERVTFQHFRTNDPNLALLAPHNCDATVADGSDQWPPDLIFDVAYGCAALAKWGTRQFIHFAQKNTCEIYYGQGEGRNGDDGNGGNTVDDKIPDDSQPVQPTSGHAERSATRRAAGGVGQNAAPGVPDFHDMILGLWMSSAKKDQRRAESAKTDRTKKEVQAWLGSVE